MKTLHLTNFLLLSPPTSADENGMARETSLSSLIIILIHDPKVAGYA